MADKFGNIYISGVCNMAKIDRTSRLVGRTIKFLIIAGVIIYIDTIIDMTSNTNKFIQVVIYNIFGLRAGNIDIYMSLYAAIAALLSSNTDIGKKLWYSIGLIVAYFAIFIFLIVGKITYPYYSYPTLNLILTLIAFITMTFPILLWIMLDDSNKNDERSENNKKVVRYREQFKSGRKNKSV